MQIRPVVVPVRGVELVLAALPERGQADDPAVRPPAPHLVERFRADGLHLPAQPETHQDAAGVGRGLDARADLAEFGGLFQDGDPQAAVAQRQSGGQTAESSPTTVTSND
ncbi:hypothetical protein SSPO_099510 [Streptomyces antimycoticus]|uniref:Uncharacterized protein n=1 Tax=Streptomyces antimycoticus TaxID=68175 RepID=A0A499UYS5_9ACTN|nr:hypothetical protein SSPO_099510 [Streptomyces antimycoticus]